MTINSYTIICHVLSMTHMHMYIYICIGYEVQLSTPIDDQYQKFHVNPNTHPSKYHTGWWFGNVWNMKFIFSYIGNFIIPFDYILFFRRVGQPPTSIKKTWVPGGWFGTCFIFHNIWVVILPIDELVFFKMVETTKHKKKHGYLMNHSNYMGQTKPSMLCR